MSGYENPHDRQIAEQLRARLLCLSWWRGVMSAFPGGVVPVATAGRILGVSRQRVDSLIDEGRLPVIDDMPGGNLHDRFIPLDALLGCPTALDSGRPLVRQEDEQGRTVYRRRLPAVNPWSKRLGG